jgi:hypothetical protein
MTRITAFECVEAMGAGWSGVYGGDTVGMVERVKRKPFVKM